MELDEFVAELEEISIELDENEDDEIISELEDSAVELEDDSDELDSTEDDERTVISTLKVTYS